MFFHVIGTARDVAIILLALEAFVLCLAVLLVTYFVQRGLGRLLPQIALALVRAREFLGGVQAAVHRLSASITAPFIWVSSKSAAVQALVRRIRQSGRAGR